MSDEAKQIPFELPLRTSANPEASGIVYDAADLGVLSAEGFVGVADRQQARAEYAARAINVFAELVAMLERCQNVLCMSEVFDLDRDVADLLKRAKGD